MICILCQLAGAEDPAKAIGMLDGKPVCQFHVSPIGPRPAPLPPHTETPFQRKKLDIDAIKEAHADGLTPAEIAEEFGCSVETVRERLKMTSAQAVPEGESPSDSPNGKGEKPVERKQLDVEAMKADRAGGMSFAAIGKKYGCGATTVRSYVLNGQNGHKPDPAKRESTATRANGHQVNGSGNDLDEISEILNATFTTLPLKTRLRLLVDHAAQV